MTQENNQQIPDAIMKQALEAFPITMERCDGGPHKMFGMCDINYYERQAYIKGLLQSPSGKCREALQRIIDLYPSSHEHGMANIALNDIRQTAIDALTLDSREDQDELWKEVGRMIMAGYDESSEDIMTETLKSKFIVSKK